MMKFTLKALLLAVASYTASAALGDDYITAVPSTVYEAAEISPQNADYDKDNKMFIAHPGWLNSKVRSFLTDLSISCPTITPHINLTVSLIFAGDPLLQGKFASTVHPPCPSINAHLRTSLN
jgi:hypothetical protein